MICPLVFTVGVTRTVCLVLVITVETVISINPTTFPVVTFFTATLSSLLGLPPNKHSASPGSFCLFVLLISVTQGGLSFLTTLYKIGK